MTVRVELGERSYTVHIGSGELARAGDTIRSTLKAPARRVFLGIDSGVPTQAINATRSSLAAAGYEIWQSILPGGETCKNFSQLEDLLTQFSLARLERSDLVLAIGGGAVCDLVGFAASIYRRGVQVLHCPTTLLAMVDASVGGKTGINLTVSGSLKKNMVGAFWQPSAVIADIAVLRSLPAREFRAGLAECIKHGLIAGHGNDPALLDWIAASLPSILSREPSNLSEFVRRNVAVKAAIIAGDEREEAPDTEGGRALLNLGHTFGHVIEALPDISADQSPAPLLHGECVALGLLAASVTSEHLNLAAAGTADRVAHLLQAAGLPTATRNLPDAPRLIELMKDDKKSLGGSLRLILPNEPGRASVVRNPDPRSIAKGWDRIRVS